MAYINESENVGHHHDVKIFLENLPNFVHTFDETPKQGVSSFYFPGS
jgi:hypothetical protein